MTPAELLETAKRLKALADVGLLYGANEYDRERYNELRDVSLRLLSAAGNYDEAALKQRLPPPPDYPTAKVDVRGLLLSADKKILLIQERVDGRWSLPGGWADVGYSPKETIIKEFKEETGLDVEPRQLLAVFDKRLHPHPPQPFYVYKMVFFCEAVSSTTSNGFDVLDTAYFEVDNLPPLSEDRILKSQIELLYQKAVQNEAAAWVD